MLIETTMRFDPEREVVWVWPDRHAGFLVSRNAVEDLARGSNLSEDELIAACRNHEAQFAAAADRKRAQGQIDPDGHVVVTTLDVNR